MSEKLDNVIARYKGTRGALHEKSVMPCTAKKSVLIFRISVTPILTIRLEMLPEQE